MKAMSKTHLVPMYLAVCLTLFSSSVTAREINDIQIPETVTISNNIHLKLNGVGIRTKFFFDIYIGALYVENVSHSAEEIISSIGANQILMHFLYDGVSKEKITSAWTEGFEDNNSKPQMKKLRPALEKFNSLFSDTKKGDVILLSYVPHNGTDVSINKKLKGNILGEDFNQALRKVWLGSDPADSDLKEAMLGISEDE